MGHSINNLAYWGPLLDRSLESTWETVIEHKASSLIAVFLIAIVHSLWKHRREAVSVKIEAGWKHKLKWAISALKKEFIPIVCITLIVFFAFLLIHVCFVTPQAISLEANRQYKTTLEKYGSEGVCWAPPKVDWNRNGFMLLFGGHYNAAMIAGVPIIFNLDELRGDRSKIIDLKDMYGKEYPAITARFKDDRVYFDAEIPSGFRHIKVECGETEMLPKGWDWASDVNALEIVDNQHRVIFREQVVNTNTIQIQGTIVFQHYTLSTQDTGSITVGLNAGFDVSDFYLPPIFQYPSVDHKGERAK
ncbi:MAG: hypothetical protein ABR924_22065 [Terracidiphilus sp.]|jgi:hypothetical protein